jgi:hypothetical protein
MPPRRKKQKHEVPWADQPVVETFETSFGRLRTVACPMPKKAINQMAKIFVVDDGGGLIKTHCECKVSIKRAKDRDAVIERYRKYHDEDTMEAAEAEREEQGRKAVEAVVAASDEMGLRGGRVALPKSDAPVATAQTVRTCTLTRRKNVVLADYYQDRARPLFDRTWGGTVIIERLGGGSAGRLSCVSELGAANIKRHPLLVKRFKKLTPATDEVEDADDVLEVVDEDAMAVDAVAATPAPIDEASDEEAAAREGEDEDEADDASAPIEGAWRPAFRFGCDEGSSTGRLASPMWRYLSAEGIEHGPFPAHQMVRWAEKGELRPDLRVARDAGGSPLGGRFVELQSLCADPAGPAVADAEDAAPVPTDDAATPAPADAATAPEPLAVPEGDMSDADRAEAEALKTQVDEFLDLWDTEAFQRDYNGIWKKFGPNKRFQYEVLDGVLARVGLSSDDFDYKKDMINALLPVLEERPKIMNAPPPGLQMTGPAVLNFEMPSVDPSYFLNTGGDFHFSAYEKRATPAAWAERLQYRYFRQKMEPFFLCGCLCLSLFSYIWTSFLTAFLISLAWGCAYMSNGHIVGLNRSVVEAELDAHVRALLDDPSRPRAPTSRLRRSLPTGCKPDAWVHHDAIVSIPRALNRRQPRVPDDETLLGEVRCGASGMNGNLKITCVAWCSVLACYMVVLLECHRRFPRPLHKPSARQAEEWRDAAKALGAAEGQRGQNAAHAANPVKFDRATGRGFVLTKLDLRALARFCDYQIPKMERFIKELDACVEDIAWRSQIPVDAVTEEMLEDALDALEEEDAAPDVGRLSAAFDSGMLRRLKAFVVELREKRKEMPDPCATWDNNGGDLGNGTWPAARINAADKQYTLEAVQAP